MSRPCSVCTRPDRAAIDDDLSGGLGLTQAASRYGISRSALQRHRTDHLGRAVTVRLPPTRPGASVSAPTATPPSGSETGSAPELPAASVYALDLPAEVSRLFDTAAASARVHGVQAYAQVAFSALMEACVLARHARDPNVLARVGRDLMRAVATHALVPADKLRELPGWVKPPEVQDPMQALHDMLLASVTGDAPMLARAEAKYEASCDAWNLAHPDREQQNRSFRWDASPETPAPDVWVSGTGSIEPGCTAPKL